MNILKNPAVLSIFASLVVVSSYYFYNKENEDTDNSFYVKLFVLVFVVCFLGAYFLYSSEELDDGFLNQNYETKCPELVPKKLFKRGKKVMRGPSVSVDSLKLLDPVSLGKLA